MTARWLDAQTDSDVDALASEFWNRIRAQVAGGEFWADRIKEIRGKPAQRLRLAMDNLPLPAAFREAALAVRPIIRQLRKDNADFTECLRFLYWLAAMGSFSIPYSAVLQEPGYNIMESVPGGVLRALPFSYKDLGYQKLRLLTKTDVKWLVEAWGEPAAHTTLHELHHGVWAEYEERLRLARQRRAAEVVDELVDLARRGGGAGTC